MFTINIRQMVCHFIGCEAAPPVITSLGELKAQLTAFEERSMQSMQELATAINEVTAKVAKIETETRSLLGKISDLEAAIESMDQIPEEVTAALVSLQNQVAVVDGLVPDEPAPAPQE